MKKHELIAERNALRRKIDDQDFAHRIKQRDRENQLVQLGLIPDKYVQPGGPFDSRRIDWYQVDQDLKDLEAYEAAERGRKLAGVGETTIEVNLDTSGFQEALKKFVERGRRAKPRKPWMEAKPGEIWVLETDQHPEPRAFKASNRENYATSNFTQVHSGQPIYPMYEQITAGRRIWPEEAGDDK